MNRTFDIAVLGAGAWGTALATLMAQQGWRVALWSRSAETATRLKLERENPRLPGITLPAALEITSAFPDAAVLLLAVPMQHSRAVLTQLPARAVPLVLCCKGLEAGSLLLPPELARSLHPEMPVAMLSGPNFAHEIAAGLPAASVLATEDAALRFELMAALHSPSLRLYGSADVTGVALGGAAKNVIAIAAGVVMGARLGESARAALITRGIAEIGRLAEALHGRAETLAGLSGIGDLLLTCTGASSRNFSAGLALGQGIPLAEILSRRSAVTEGVATAPALLARARRAGVEMPITEVVAALLAGSIDIAGCMTALMGRVEKDE